MWKGDGSGWAGYSVVFHFSFCVFVSFFPFLFFFWLPLQHFISYPFFLFFSFLFYGIGWAWLGLAFGWTGKEGIESSLPTTATYSE